MFHPSVLMLINPVLVIEQTDPAVPGFTHEIRPAHARIRPPSKRSIGGESDDEHGQRCGEGECECEHTSNGSCSFDSKQPRCIQEARPLRVLAGGVGMRNRRGRGCGTGGGGGGEQAGEGVGNRRAACSTRLLRSFGSGLGGGEFLDEDVSPTDFAAVGLEHDGALGRERL